MTLRLIGLQSDVTWTAFAIVVMFCDGVSLKFKKSSENKNVLTFNLIVYDL